MDRMKPVGLLSEPVVTLDSEEGRVVSAYIQLREGVKAAGCFQPDPDVLVFLDVAHDGVPIGVSLHEPADGPAVCQLVDRMFAGRDPFPDARELSAFLNSLRETLVGMRVAARSDR